MWQARPEVWQKARRHPRRQLLEPAASQVRKAPTIGRARGFFVEKDRDLKSLGHCLPDPTRERYTVGHRRTFERNKRHDIDGTETGVHATMGPKIDLRHDNVVQGDDRALETGRVSRKREDRSVVRHVGGMVEKGSAGYGSYGARDPIDQLVVPSLADVRYALDHVD